MKSNLNSDCKVPIVWQGGLQRLSIAYMHRYEDEAND